MKKRSFDFEVKELDDNGEFVGYLAVTGNKDEYDDVIEPGAFKKTNRENDRFPLLWQHQPDEPIGVLKDFEEDETGEKVIGDINLETQKGKEAYSLLKQGAIKGLSIGYESVKDVIEEGIRRIKEIKLYEGSVVTFPANPLAMVQSVKEDNNELAEQVFNLQRTLKGYFASKGVGLIASPEQKPYEGEHACRLKNPDDFQDDSFRRINGDRESDGKSIDVIYGRLEGEDTMTEQAYRYPDDEWNEEAAKNHCEDHDGIEFEGAVNEESSIGSDELSLSLLQTVGISKHFKSKTLTNRHKRLIDETIDSLKSLRPTEPEDSTRDGKGADTSDREPHDTLDDLVSDMKQYVNQQR